MVKIQSSPGIIEIFEDFIGPEWVIAESADDSINLGALRVIGEGIETDDSGITINESDPCLGGVARFTTTDEDLHSVGLTTGTMFDVALMAPIVLECRLQFPDSTTHQFFFGLSDVNVDSQILEDTLVNVDSGAGTTVTLSASDLCGFLTSTEATSDRQDWHAVYNGGTATGATTSTDLDLDEDYVVGEWQVLRLVVEENGTAKWYINGELKKTLVGAVSTTTNLAAQAILENLANTSSTEKVDIDYILIRAGRDWTV